MPYTGLGLNHSVSTALGPGRLAKRQNLNTSDSRYQAPKNSAKPTSIRYGVGLFSHLPTRYVSSSHAPISPADADCFTLDMKRMRPPSGGRVHSASVLAPGRRERDLAVRVLGRFLRLDARERH